MMARWFSNMAEKRSGFRESFGSIAMLYAFLLAEVGGSIAVLCLKGLKDYLHSFKIFKTGSLLRNASETAST